MRVLAGISNVAKRERPPLGVWRSLKYGEEKSSFARGAIVVWTAARDP